MKNKKGAYKTIMLFQALLATLVFVYSCGVKRYIPEDELLYEGASLEVKPDTLKNRMAIEEGLESVLGPEPNSKFLGMRPRLHYHYKAQREKPGFLIRFLNKKFGEEPVYASDVELTDMEEILQNRMENNGFFYGNVVSEIIADSAAKTARAKYSVRLRQPYTLASFQLDNDSLDIYKDIGETFDETIFKKEMRFSLNAMKAERTRIDDRLKKKGYYNFNPNFLIFEADSNQYDNRKFDLYLKLKKDVPEKSIVPYKIETVNVYPNYTVETDSVERDTARFADKNFIQKDLFFEPKRLDPFIVLEEGQYYSPKTSRNTSRRLGSIGAYKFINIEYKELDSAATDSLGKLEANIYLSPLSKRSLRAELQAVTKSNGFVGPTLALTFSNRNLFHGGETLNLSAKLGYEVQTGGGLSSRFGNSSLILGLNADLFFPRMLFPISIDKNWFKYAIPKTKVSLGTEYLDRSGLFSLISGTGSFGYTWQANKYVTHELNPISINYVQLANTTEEFDAILDDNPFLQTSFDQQFISGLTYSFIYNGMVDATKTHQFYLNLNFDTAGNSLNLLAPENDMGAKSILGLEFAQFAKVDGDLRYHLQFGKDHKIAARLFAGIGEPYGNSDVLPFTKQYFSGGPYSVRAFQIRSLGPGTYTPPEDDDSSFFDRTGNIRLEGNLEYRFPIFGVVKGAFFADAGNVWNTNETNLEGGTFSSNWINELGIGVGTGIRIDVQGFVIRFDLAAPLHDPALPEGERFDFNLDRPVFNFAIGYPF